MISGSCPHLGRCAEEDRGSGGILSLAPSPPEPRCTFVKEGLTLTVVAGADCWCRGSYFIEFPASTNIAQPLLYSTCRGTHIWRVYV